MLAVCSLLDRRRRRQGNMIHLTGYIILPSEFHLQQRNS